MAGWRLLWLALGPLALVLVLGTPVPEGMRPEAWHTTGVAGWMALWWITEAIPIPATALLPLVLLPLLGVVGIEGAASPYANPVIYLFLGGFLLAAGMQRWGLHRRIALHLVSRVGARPPAIIAGFMVAAAFLSMWVSNTATAVMMLPIGVSVIQLAKGAEEEEPVDPGDSNFGLALMLGIAYACSIGGLGTLVGTPPNAFLAGFMMEAYEVEIGFGQWMLLGVPLVGVGLPLAWVVLTRWVYPVGRREIPGGAEALRREVGGLGPMSRGERRVAIVFGGAALAWMARPLMETWVPGLSDPGIAIAAALVLFVLPVDARERVFVLDWEAAREIPWGVLLLFGGGLSLAGAITRTGLAGWLGEVLAGLGVLPLVALVGVTVLLIIFLTEVTSNTATAAAFLPVLGALAVTIGESPLVLVVPAALGASCAFMMPVATPPNAIVFGSGHVTIPQMVRAGFWLNLLFAALISGVGYLLVILVFGATPGEVPGWAE